MKHLRLLWLAVLLSGILCGCHSPSKSGPILPENEQSAEIFPMEDQNPASKDIHVIKEDDLAPPRDGMLRSPLTNEWVPADQAASRPIAMMIPNESGALPHYHLSEASVLYEATVEGHITRLMAIYDDWRQLVRVGNIRSARTYYIYWSYEWDAFLVHFGGPYYINSLTEDDTTENIDGLSGDGKYFYRSKDREDPHNVYTDGSLLLESIQNHGYNLSYRSADNAHFTFTPKAEPNALTQYDGVQNATYIDMSGCYPLTRCYFEFNESDGLYYRYQHLSGSSDGPHEDADGHQLAFKNVLVQYIKQETLDEKGYLVFQCHDTTRDGWYFTNGRGIHVTWKKESDYAPTKFYDDDGKEIVLNTGKTMICVVDEKSSFIFR